MTATVFMTGSQLLAKIAAHEAAAAARAAEVRKADERRARRRESARRRRDQKRAALKATDVLALPVEIVGHGAYSAFVRQFCLAIGAPVAWLVSQHRQAPIVTTRHIAGWIGVRCYHRSYPLVGRILHRDHTTILHSVRKIDRLIAERGLTVPADPMAAALYLNRELGGVQ